MFQVRVYTPVGKQEQGKFALDVATKVLPYYKEYFSIAYPLPKIDLIAIADFSVGKGIWTFYGYTKVMFVQKRWDKTPRLHPTPFTPLTLEHTN